MSKLNDVCKGAIEKYGEVHQIEKSIEKMSDLIMSLSATTRNKEGSSVLVLGDIAKVFISLEQLMLIFGIDEAENSIRIAIAALESEVNEN